MKKLAVYSLIAALSILPAAAYADAPAGAVVATVNIQAIMKDSTAAQDVREQLEKKQKSFQDEISKKEDELQKENQELGHEQSVLSKPAFEKKAEAFRSKATKAQKEVQSKKALLDSAFERSIGQIQKAVTDIITDMAKEKGFTVAIPTSQVLYADPKLDITDEVLKRLNQKLPKIKVSFDAAE